MQETNDVQFDITIYLPRKPSFYYTEIERQLGLAFKVYQEQIVPDEKFYFFKNSVRVNEDKLVYDNTGFTEFGSKKIISAWKRIEKQGDTMISFTDGSQEEIGLVVDYTAMKCFMPKEEIQSEISFFLTKPENSKTVEQIINFVTGFAKVFSDNYITIVVDNRFTRSDFMFGYRISCSLIAYIPAPLQAYDFPEAHKLIPINNGEGKQVGTVIVSLDHFPYRENVEDVKTINRLDLRLRELKLLPKTLDL
ncbi:Imm52 family immunity protein [Orbaceae bacterium ESL0721]|nr:Imm52 family immunity protein [Orbaceae bacterium ESL0721]